MKKRRLVCQRAAASFGRIAHSVSHTDASLSFLFWKRNPLFTFFVDLLAKGRTGGFMRTIKRFTPTLLARFTREGRGTGTYLDYIPWHRVGRGDPASLGRSHLMMWRGRQLELLSDGEWVAVLFSTMLPDLLDVREQFKLSLEASTHELASYDYRFGGHKTYPGTREIAKQLGIKHPMVHGDGLSDFWTMTTDQLLLLGETGGQPSLLAIARKPNADELSKRDRQKLLIEKEYWSARGVCWLLLTPDVFEESVGLTLRRGCAWALGDHPLPAQTVRTAVEVVKSTLGYTLTHTIRQLSLELGDDVVAQRAFWQAVWSSKLEGVPNFV